MDFNTLLFRLGLDPNCFINRLNEPIKTDSGFIYEVEQRKDIRICPTCKSTNAIINDYDYVEINCSETNHITDTVRIKKVRFKCKDCNKSFTPVINGIKPYSRISDQSKTLIYKDFFLKLSFTDIANKFGLSVARIIQLFDELVPYVPRLLLPEVLCIDEIRFHEDPDQKYCCVLYDYLNKDVVDIIRNRQLPYLDEYFSKIPEKERKTVKYFISDMYDGYRTIHRRYFPQAIHIVDLFHVIYQLTTALNKIRTIAMKNAEKGSLQYNFMKSHWKLFLCRKEDIPDKYYYSRKTGKSYHFDDLVDRCVKSDSDLLEAYNVLQDLFHYHQKYTYKKALAFVEHISNRLLLSSNEQLRKVGRTYSKWNVEIARAFSNTNNGIRYTNSIAECINNHLKTIIKIAYGYHNFERFRKRVMLIISYKKT